MKRSEALKEASKLLRDEANELAVILERPEGRDLPHRVKVAIQREITRFRDIANLLHQA